MNQVRNLAMIISAVLVLSGTAAAQRRPRPKPKPAPVPAATPASTKRPVTVNLKQGDPVAGNFLRADAETVQIEVQSGQLTIKMNEVASLVFTDEEEPAKPAEEAPKDSAPAPANPTLPAARKASAALSKLAEAAKIKLPYGQYGNLLIEVRPAIDEALIELPDGTLKIEITRAMENYTDAAQAWGAAQVNGRVPITDEPGARLMRKYEIKPGVNRLGQADHLEIDTALKTIWAVAESRLNYIATLIKRLTPDIPPR